jgi:hypothetical protein
MFAGAGLLFLVQPMFAKMTLTIGLAFFAVSTTAPQLQ